MKRTFLFFTLALSSTLSINAQAAATYKVTEVADGGSITGKVAFSGKDEAPKVYGITKDNDVCGTGNREIDYVKVNNGALGDVVVYLDKVKEGKDFEADAAGGNLDQKGCEFSPFLQVMKNDGKLEVKNSDPVLHNIHTYEIMGRAKKTVFNISQPDPNTIHKSVKLKRGDAMKIECDAHDFMHGFVFVAKNPYYAIVGADGSYSIDNIPAGKYTVKAWHGKLKEQKTKVDVAAGAAAEANFDFK
jgi:hypothetical protein